MIAAALVLGAAVAPAACPGWDVSLHLGVGLSHEATTGDVDVSRAGSLAGGARLDRCFDLPLRAELSFTTSTVGGTAGVNAVQVSSWTGEVDLVAGVLWPWVVREQARLGAELLVGPGFQLTRTVIRIYGDRQTDFGVRVLAAFGGGVFLESIGFRLTARVLAGAPRERELRLLLGVGHTIF